MNADTFDRRQAKQALMQCDPDTVRTPLTGPFIDFIEFINERLRQFQIAARLGLPHSTVGFTIQLPDFQPLRLFNSAAVRSVWDEAHRIRPGRIHSEAESVDNFYFPAKEALGRATALFFHDRIEKI